MQALERKRHIRERNAVLNQQAWRIIAAPRGTAVGPCWSCAQRSNSATMADTALEKEKGKSKEKAKTKENLSESPKGKKEIPERKKPASISCFGCDIKFNPVEGEKLCNTCKGKLKNPVNSPEGTEGLVSWMKGAMLQAFESFKQKPNKEVLQADSPFYEDFSSDTSFGEGTSKFKYESESEEGEISESKDFFPVDDIGALIAAVRDTMGLEESSEPPKKSSKLFANISKRKPSFPVDEAIKNKIKSQWSVLDKKWAPQKKFYSLFPFEVEDTKFWDVPPKLDPPVAQTIKRTTLPLEDSTGLRDAMDRKAEGALRKTYLAAAAGFKPAIAAASVARSLKVWILQLEKALKKGVPRENLLADLPMVISASDFLTEAALSSVDILAKTTAFATSARRALWLKPWVADIASKNRLLNLPFEGEKLFGSQLELLVEKKSDDKVRSLPQDKKLYKRPSFRGFRTSYKYRQDWTRLKLYPI
ncbi:hypothetical protein XENTR_v10014354 [Xenopus tropicalis]|nr:hypothetical protein XENTR_v10014354 [Xenopus tropicalis]